MRSGTGRHRRPRQAPAILVTAGVTGASIAGSLLAASGAQAVEASTWDRVAECESGGAWSLNTDSGYYGGFQLTQKTWEKYGGLHYAQRPDLASRTQQIEVAEKVLAAEGPRAWPMCAIGTGLAEEVYRGAEQPSEPDDDATRTPDGNHPDDAGSPDGTGDRDRPGSPGEGDDAAPSGPSDTSVPPADERPAGDSETSEDADDPDQPHDGHDPDQPHDDGSHPEGDASDRPGNGKHRGEPDPAEQGPKERDERRYPDRPDREERGRDDGRTAVGSHRVKVGDTLSAIAEQHRVPGGWPELYAANEVVIGGDPDLIHPGRLLRLGEDADHGAVERPAR